MPLNLTDGQGGGQGPLVVGMGRWAWGTRAQRGAQVEMSGPDA